MGLIGYIKYYNVIIDHKLIPWTLYTPLTSTLKLFTLYFDALPVKDTSGTYVIEGTEWFIILIYIARILAFIATGHMLFRILHPLIKQTWSNFKYRVIWNRHEQVLIIGDNEENRMIYRSAEEKKGDIRPMLLCFSEAEFFKAYDENFFCVSQKAEDVVKNLLQSKLKNGKRRCTIVINTKNEEKNLSICGTVVDCVSDQLSEKVNEINLLRKSADNVSHEKLIQEENSVNQKLDRIRVIVFGDQKYETAYHKLEQESFGILRYTNKARKVAMNLIYDYPVTSFIDRSRYIDQFACLDKSFDINVIFVGFGDDNQELFVSSTIINQFIEADKGEIPHPKKIFYYIYEKKGINSGNLNHKIFRLRGIKREMFREEDYLEIPPDPAEYISSTIDINSPGFYEQLWAVCSANPNSLNVIYVALGNDIENIDLAQKLQEKAGEWQLPDTRIFVNIEHENNYRLLTNDDSLIPYGSEKKHIFKFDHLFNDELEDLAIKKHYMNALLKSEKPGKIQWSADEIETDSLYEWYTYDAIKKISSLYSILSIRSKLQMMGLDYRKKQPNSDSLKSNDDYFDIYAKDDRPKLDHHYNKTYHKDIYCYPNCLEKEDLTHQSLRQNLAIQEHYRWNAFMISFGFIPSSIEKIRTDKEGHGRDYKNRTHGNLTTAAGLIDFRDLIADPTVPKVRADVLNYDFHLMDDVWWYLDMFGYEMYKR